MRRLVFIASHLGYPMDKTPLGGGAMVGQALVREWAKSGDFEITALGAGPESPDSRVEYVQLGRTNAHAAPELVKLSELQYAKFCRVFERATTQWLLSRRAQFPPQSTAVVVNDLSEGPDLQALRRAGYSPVSVWHVDVADYFCRMYLKGLVASHKAIWFHEAVVKAGGSGLVPEVLSLVFEKQRQTVLNSARLIFPSQAMAGIVRRSYPGFFRSEMEFQQRTRVVPWGAWDTGEVPAENHPGVSTQALKEHYQIGPQSQVLMTLSRLAPEKGVHLLIEALALLEQRPDFGDKDICLFVCGAPAFMRGAAYARRVRLAAQKLRKTRVFFPGYLGPEEKRAFFGLAQVFVSPSIHESYGLNALEAMRAGVAVLALEHYGSRDWPRQDFAQVVSPSNNTAKARAAALADGLQNLFSDTARLKVLGRQAAAFAAAQPFSKAAAAVAREAFSVVEAEKDLPQLALK